MSSNSTGIKVGSKGHGVVGNYPPATWRLAGKRANVWTLENVKHPSQSTSYPDQHVDWATVERIMANAR